MKLNNLMLDDILFDTSSNKVVRVRNISRNGINARRNGKTIVDITSKNCLEGILLTKEIMLKNDFDNSEPFFGFNLGSISSRFYYWCLGKIYLDNICICDCIYVHELQHFLKNVGIKKNIII